MFQGLDPADPVDVFAHLPALAFTEAFIYQLDDSNEEAVAPGAQTAPAAAAAGDPFTPLLQALEVRRCRLTPCSTRVHRT